MTDVTFERFGGLNLVQDPQEAGAEQAISCLNVILDRNGRVRTRDGYDVVYDSNLAANPFGIHPVSYTDDTVLVALAANKVRAVDLSAGTSSAEVNLGSTSSSFASAGSAVYFTDGTTTQVRKFSAGAFSSPAGLASYEGNFLAVQPLDDRLVIADANNTSRLWFSDAATPETITYSAGPPETGNFVELTPGDGEQITGMEVFGTDLYVFKQTKFFVFYGNSTDGTGGSVFNYRMVDTGVGCNGGQSLKLTATHETGVYFVGQNGVYRTVGGPPVKVSGVIDPVFTGMNLPIPVPFSSVLPAPLGSFYRLDAARGCLYLFGVRAASTTPYQFVMDLQTGVWTAHDLAAVSMLDGGLAANPGSIVLGVLAGTDGAVALHNDSFTDDDGAAISWHHQSGFYDLGTGNTKRIGPVHLWGSGTPTVSVFKDHGTADANAGSVTLGVSPAIERGQHSKTYQGRLFSHRLSGTGPAVINRLAIRLRGQRLL